MVTRALPSLFELAEQWFVTFATELAAYGLQIGPELRLERGEGMMCHYDLATGVITLSLPDLGAPVGRLQAIMVGSFLGLDSEIEVETFFRSFVPRLVAHELGHYLRHQHRMFGTDLWLEEQVANRLASALTRHRMPYAERERARMVLRRALDTLSLKASVPDAAALTYEDILRGLNVSGVLDDAAHRSLEVTRSILALGRRQAYVELSNVTSATEYLATRARVIDEINSEYASDFARYMYYHVGWLYLDLSHRGGEYVEDLARTFLGCKLATLPPLEHAPASASDAEIRACFRASRELAEHPLARFFYSRYRELLWARVSDAADDELASIRREAAFFLESFSTAGTDAIASLARVAPDAVRPLFPGPLESSAVLEDPRSALREDADRRLFCHVADGVSDQAAFTTAERLSLLGGSEVFGAVPASSLLELVPLLCRVVVASGDTLIWEHELNSDVYFVSSGELEVFRDDAEGGAVARLVAGDVIGELAFFSRARRQATVRARGDAECFVVRDVDLTRFAFRHPSVVLEMAKAVALRATHRAEPVEPHDCGVARISSTSIL